MSILNKSVKEFLGWILKYLVIVITTIALVLGGDLLFIESHKLISEKNHLYFTQYHLKVW